MIIDISVKNKIATLVDPNIYGVCHNGDYTVRFEFDSEWDEFATKTMRINYDGYSSSVIFSGNECTLPIISQPGPVEIGVFAGDLHTTTPATISFIKSVASASGPEPDPTPDVYAQIIKMLEDLEVGTSTTKDGTVVSPNADFAEVAEWADGNPDNEDRTGYFVCANVPVDGIVMRKATSIDDVKGVTIKNPAFAGNYTDDKLDGEGNLLPKYSFVAVIGFVPVIDNGTCTVGGRCMPDDNGCAIPSDNSMGYQVVNRIDENRVLIIIEPNGDMIQRVKSKLVELAEAIANLDITGSTTIKVVNDNSVILNGSESNEIIDTKNGYNVTSGMNNTLGTNGYKMLSITHAEDGLSIDIELDDAKFEESNRAITNYAVKDAVVIQGSVFNVEDYAIFALTTNEAGNTVVTVASWSSIKKAFTNEPVSAKIALDGSDPIVEDWFWVRGKSFGEPVGRTQGSFLGGMENTSSGRYTFGGGRQNQLVGDGATGFGRQNIIGYLAFVMGRSNIGLGGYVFGQSNKTEFGATPFISGTNNEVYSGSKLSMIFGHGNRVHKGDRVGIVGHNNTITGDAKASMIVGGYNELQGGDSNFITGIRHKVQGLYNFVTGAWNTIKGTDVLAAGQFIEDSETTINSGFIGKGLIGSGTEQLVVGHFNKDDVDAALIVGNGVNKNSRKNAFVVKKDGSAKVQGDITANGVNINQTLAQTVNAVGDIDVALDNIIAMQNSLIGGEIE